MTRSVIALLISIVLHGVLLSVLTLPLPDISAADAIRLKISNPVMAEIPVISNVGTEISPPPAGNAARNEPNRTVEPPFSAPDPEEPAVNNSSDVIETGNADVSGSVQNAGTGNMESSRDSGSGEGDAAEMESGGVDVDAVQNIPAAPPPNLDSILAEYRQRVLSAISAHKVYPAAARRLGQEGEVRIRFRVAASGAVSGVEVVGSSGNELLDVAAADAVSAASPVPPVPEELGSDGLTLSLLIVFELGS